MFVIKIDHDVLVSSKYGKAVMIVAKVLGHVFYGDFAPFDFNGFGVIHGKSKAGNAMINAILDGIEGHEGCLAIPGDEHKILQKYAHAG